MTGDPLKFAGSKALGSAFGRLSDMVSRRLDEVVPAIYVANDRSVTVIFISGVTLEGYDVPDSDASPHSGLDR